jgi:hypothetical protein
MSEVIDQNLLAASKAGERISVIAIHLHQQLRQIRLIDTGSSLIGLPPIRLAA